MDWWSDNWQFVVGTGIAVLGILVGIAIALWQRQPKRLDYDVINNVAILSTQTGNLSEKLDVEYEGVKLRNPRVVTIRIKNTGKRAIEPSEYEIPVTVEYRKNPPLGGFVSDLSSNGVSADIQWLPEDWSESHDPNRVVIVPGLLNRKEWFDGSTPLNVDGGL